MSGPEIMALVAFFVLLFATFWGIWWRIEGKVKEAKDGAMASASSAQALDALARDELAGNKLHVAETYLTKAGMRETTEQIMKATGGMKSAVDAMTLRINRFV